LQYRIRETTPLKFHNFVRYFSLPVGIVSALVSIIIIINNLYYFDWLSVLGVVYYAVIIGLLVTTFIGFLRWKRIGYICLLSALALEVFFALASLIGYSSYPSDVVASYVGNLIGILVYAIPVYIYYRKRAPLFTKSGDKPAPAANAYADPWDRPAYPNANAQTKPAPAAGQPRPSAFCTGCGAPVDPDVDRFCRRCGTAVK